MSYYSRWGFNFLTNLPLLHSPNRFTLQFNVFIIMIMQIFFTEEPRIILWLHFFPCTISVFSGVNDYLIHFSLLHSLFEPMAKSSYTFQHSCKIPLSAIVHLITLAKLSDSLSVLLCCFVLFGFCGFFFLEMSLLGPSGLLQSEPFSYWAFAQLSSGNSFHLSPG